MCSILKIIYLVFNNRYSCAIAILQLLKHKTYEITDDLLSDKFIFFIQFNSIEDKCNYIFYFFIIYNYLYI